MKHKLISGLTIGLIVGMLAISYSDDVADFVNSSKKQVAKKLKKMSILGN